MQKEHARDSYLKNMETNRDLYFHYAVDAFNQKLFVKALILFKKALSSPFTGEPNNDGLILCNIATCHNKLSQYTDAVSNYLLAIKKGLNNEDIFFSLAVSYCHLGKNAEALEVYNEILRANSNNGKCYYLRGKLYQRMGEYLKGSHDIGMAVSLNYYG
jgi:tetratricopeptide (TPR) repeat protein